MKKAVLLLFVAATFSCCKKEKGLSAAKNSLVDKWGVRQSSGGLAGTIVYPPGNGNILEFKSDNSYAYYNKVDTVQTGTYSLQSAPEKDEYRVTFHNNTYDLSQNISLKGDTLVLLSSARCCDMPDVTYVRFRQLR